MFRPFSRVSSDGFRLFFVVGASQDAITRVGVLYTRKDKKKGDYVQGTVEKLYTYLQYLQYLQIEDYLQKKDGRMIPYDY